MAAAIGIFATLGLLVFRGLTVSPVAIVSIFIDITLLLAWNLLVTPEWVRLPGEVYAERLIAACEKL
jgi:hypothetical protein